MTPGIVDQRLGLEDLGQLRGRALLGESSAHGPIVSLLESGRWIRTPPPVHAGSRRRQPGDATAAGPAGLRPARPGDRADLPRDRRPAPGAGRAGGGRRLLPAGGRVRRPGGHRGGPDGPGQRPLPARSRGRGARDLAERGRAGRDPQRVPGLAPDRRDAGPRRRPGRSGRSLPGGGPSGARGGPGRDRLAARLAGQGDGRHASRPALLRPKPGRGRAADPPDLPDHRPDRHRLADHLRQRSPGPGPHDAPSGWTRSRWPRASGIAC